MNVNSI